MVDPDPYYTPEDLREAAGLLDKPDIFTDAVLAELVAEFEQTVEFDRGVSYVVREATETITNHRRCAVVLKHPMVQEITAVSIDGTDWTEDQIGDLTLNAEAGIIERVGGWWGTTLVIAYTHGHDEFPPGVLRACREFVRAKASTSAGNRPRNAAAGAPGTNGQAVYPQAKTEPTGVPEADRIIATLPCFRTPGIA